MKKTRNIAEQGKKDAIQKCRRRYGESSFRGPFSLALWWPGNGKITDVEVGLRVEVKDVRVRRG